MRYYLKGKIIKLLINIGCDMKKAKLNIAIFIVLLSFCVSGYSTDVNDNSIPQPKTGTGEFTCSTIAPISIYAIPDNIVTGLIFVKDDDGNIDYNLSSYNSQTLFEVHGEVGATFYASFNMTINSSTGEAGNSVNHGGGSNGDVILNIIWDADDNGFDYQTFDVGDDFTLIYQSWGSAPHGRYYFRARYMGLTIEPDAVPGLYIFEQTVEVSYDPFDGGGGEGT